MKGILNENEIEISKEIINCFYDASAHETVEFIVEMLGRATRSSK